MTIKNQLSALLSAAAARGYSSEKCATAVLFWMDWELNLSLEGNGYLDDDKAVLSAMSVNQREFLEIIKEIQNSPTA